MKHLLDVLKPHSIENGGPLKVEHVTYVEGRGNLLLEYACEGAKGTVAFVGSHLDVVPANPETWERNPFKLTVEVMCAFCLLHCGVLSHDYLDNSSRVKVKG